MSPFLQALFLGSANSAVGCLLSDSHPRASFGAGIPLGAWCHPQLPAAQLWPLLSGSSRESQAELVVPQELTLLSLAVTQSSALPGLGSSSKEQRWECPGRREAIRHLPSGSVTPEPGQLRGSESFCLHTHPLPGPFLSQMQHLLWIPSHG